MRRPQRRLRAGPDAVRAADAAAGVRRGRTASELIHQVTQGEPPPLRKLDPRCRATWRRSCTRRSSGSRRGGTRRAAALAEDLRRFVEDRPIRARRIGATGRAWRWCKRNPVVAGAVGLAAAALVAVAVVSGLYALDRARSATRLADEGRKTKAALVELNRQFANLALERGQTSCEHGEVGRGLLWIVEGLHYAAEGKDAALQEAARANLAAWQRQLPSLRAVFSHRAAVPAVAFSPDGATILTGSQDRTAQLWDVASACPRGAPIEHQEPIMAVAFSPDGATILTGSQDKTARLWDAASGQPRGRPMEHHGPVRAVAFSPDGRTIVTGSDDETARLWDAATGTSSGDAAGTSRPGPGGGVQPRRPDRPDRRLGQHRAALGRRHRATPRDAAGTSRRGLCRGVQPRRRDDPDGEPGQDRAALGHRLRTTPRQTPGASKRRSGGGVQPRRRDDPIRGL